MYHSMFWDGFLLQSSRSSFLQNATKMFQVTYSKSKIKNSFLSDKHLSCCYNFPQGSVQPSRILWEYICGCCACPHCQHHWRSSHNSGEIKDLSSLSQEADHPSHWAVWCALSLVQQVLHEKESDGIAEHIPPSRWKYVSVTVAHVPGFYQSSALAAPIKGPSFVLYTFTLISYWQNKGLQGCQFSSAASGEVVLTILSVTHTHTHNLHNLSHW